MPYELRDEPGLRHISVEEAKSGTWVFLTAYNAGPCFVLGRIMSVDGNAVHCFAFQSFYVDIEGRKPEAREGVIRFSLQEIRERKAGMYVTGKPLAKYIEGMRDYLPHLPKDLLGDVPLAEQLKLFEDGLA